MSTEYPFQSSQSLVTQHTFTAHLFWARHPARLSGDTLRGGAAGKRQGVAPTPRCGEGRACGMQRTWEGMVDGHPLKGPQKPKKKALLLRQCGQEAEVWIWTHREQSRNAPSKFSCQMLSGNVLGYSSTKLQIQLSHLPCSADSHKPHEKYIS